MHVLVMHFNVDHLFFFCIIHIFNLYFIIYVLIHMNRCLKDKIITIIINIIIRMSKSYVLYNTSVLLLQIQLT